MVNVAEHNVYRVVKIKNLENGSLVPGWVGRGVGGEKGKNKKTIR